MTQKNTSAAEPVAYRSTARRRLQQLAPGSFPLPGTHLVTPFCGFAHHGIYAGEGRVIHYGALMYDIIRKPVEEVSFEAFAGGRDVFVVLHTEQCLDSSLVLSRARSRLGEKRYKLLSNNCEHFVEWCLHGVGRSFQAESALAYPRLLRDRIESLLRRGILKVLAAFRPATRAPARIRSDSDER